MGLLVLILSAGCAGLPWNDTTPAPDADEVLYAEGVAALDAGDFAGAEARFRRLSARCDAGAEGRNALLGLVTTKLDLRNPESDPDEAARLAAIHLNVPDAPAAERSLARTLYLLAVYRGAEPVEGPEDLDRPRTPPDSLPDDPPREGAAADSIGAAADSVGAATDSIGAQTDSIGAATDSVEAAADSIEAAGAADTAAAPGGAEGAAPSERVDSAGGAVGGPGAEPVGERTGAEPPPEPARRFDRCDAPEAEYLAWVGVPDYPGMPPIEWARSDTVVVLDRGGAGQTAALQARVRALEAELARIRKVLKGGGGEVPDPRP